MSRLLTRAPGDGGRDVENIGNGKRCVWSLGGKGEVTDKIRSREQAYSSYKPDPSTLNSEKRDVHAGYL
jgi:hypothetical protein